MVFPLCFCPMYIWHRSVCKVQVLRQWGPPVFWTCALSQDCPVLCSRVWGVWTQTWENKLKTVSAVVVYWSTDLAIYIAYPFSRFQELRSCVKVDVAVLDSPSLIVARTVSVAVKATLNSNRAQELCESRGGRPGAPIPNNSPYGHCRRKKQHWTGTELRTQNSNRARSCVKVEVAVQGHPSLITVRTVSVDVQQHRTNGRTSELVPLGSLPVWWCISYCSGLCLLYVNRGHAKQLWTANVPNREEEENR